MEYPKFEENLSTILPGMSLSMEGNRFWNLFFPAQLKPQWNKLKERNPVVSMQLLLPYELNIH